MPNPQNDFLNIFIPEQRYAEDFISKEIQKQYGNESNVVNDSNNLQQLQNIASKGIQKELETENELYTQLESLETNTNLMRIKRRLVMNEVQRLHEINKKYSDLLNSHQENNKQNQLTLQRIKQLIGKLSTYNQERNIVGKQFKKVIDYQENTSIEPHEIDKETVPLKNLFKNNFYQKMHFPRKRNFIVNEQDSHGALVAANKSKYFNDILTKFLDNAVRIKDHSYLNDTMNNIINSQRKKTLFHRKTFRECDSNKNNTFNYKVSLPKRTNLTNINTNEKHFKKRVDYVQKVKKFKQVKSNVARKKTFKQEKNNDIEVKSLKQKKNNVLKQKTLKKQYDYGPNVKTFNEEEDNNVPKLKIFQTKNQIPKGKTYKHHVVYVEPPIPLKQEANKVPKDKTFKKENNKVPKEKTWKHHVIYVEQDKPFKQEENKFPKLKTFKNKENNVLLEKIFEGQQDYVPKVQTFKQENNKVPKEKTLKHHVIYVQQVKPFKQEENKVPKVKTFKQENNKVPKEKTLKQQVIYVPYNHEQYHNFTNMQNIITETFKNHKTYDSTSNRIFIKSNDLWEMPLNFHTESPIKKPQMMTFFLLNDKSKPTTTDGRSSNSHNDKSKLSPLITSENTSAIYNNSYSPNHKKYKSFSRNTFTIGNDNFIELRPFNVVGDSRENQSSPTEILAYNKNNSSDYISANKLIFSDKNCEILCKVPIEINGSLKYNDEYIKFGGTFYLNSLNKSTDF